MWSTENDCNLIYAVGARPVLWDVQSPHYKRADLKKTAWAEIARELNSSSTEVKRRWSNLRDTYVKKRKEVGSGGGLRRWKYFKLLTFLNPSLRHYGEIVMPLTGDLGDDSLPSTTLSQPVTFPAVTSHQRVEQNVTYSPPKELPQTSNGVFLREEPNITLSQPVTSTAVTGHQQVEQNVTTSQMLQQQQMDDADDRYARTVADRLRMLSNLDKLLVKKKIDDTLFEALLKTEQ